MNISIRIMTLILSLCIFYILFISFQVNGLTNANQTNICENDRINIKITTDKKNYLKNESIPLTITNFGNKTIPFPNPALGMKIQNMNNTNFTKAIASTSGLFGLQPLKPFSFNVTLNNFPFIDEAGNYSVILSPSGRDASYKSCFTIK